MDKVPSQKPFFKVIKEHKHLGFDGMVFLAYVAEFEAQGNTCFVSRKKISEVLPISESGVRYLIKRLVEEGYLELKYEKNETGDRWIRHVITTVKARAKSPKVGANSAPGGGTKNPQVGAELNQEWGHEKATTKKQYKETYKETIQRTKPEPNLERINNAAERFGLKKRF